MTDGEEPLFTIGAVARMTSIAEDTLRIWERRYHFPRTTRTAGGHRLYSQLEVERLQWVKLRIAEGLQPSRAIHALQQAEKRKQITLSPQVTPAPSYPAKNDMLLITHQQRLMQALLDYDITTANAIFEELLALYPMEAIILDVISTTLFMIGEAWSSGQLDVAVEHFASNFLHHRMLIWMQTGPPAYHVNSVALACAPGELHEGSLLMLGVLLRRLRWPVIYLGQSLPLTDLASLVQAVRPSIIVFVAMSEITATALADWPHWLATVEESDRPIIAYGGRAFTENPRLAQHIPGLLLGNTLQEGVALLNQTLLDLNGLGG